MAGPKRLGRQTASSAPAEAHGMGELAASVLGDSLLGTGRGSGVALGLTHEIQRKEKGQNDENDSEIDWYIGNRGCKR